MISEDLVVKSSQDNLCGGISPIIGPQRQREVLRRKKFSGLSRSRGDDDGEDDFENNLFCFERNEYEYSDLRQELAKHGLMMEFPKEVDAHRKVHTCGKSSDYALLEESISLPVSNSFKETTFESPKHVSDLYEVQVVLLMCAEVGLQLSNS